MTKTINFTQAQKKLVTQWLIFSAIVFIIYLIQTLTGKFDSHAGEVWEWLFQYIIPPLTLMIGVLISQLSSQQNGRETDLFYYRLASGISYFFLILLLLTPVLVPFIHLSQAGNDIVTTISEGNEKSIIEAFKFYNYFMIPVQGITTLTLGLFFSKTK